MKANIPSTNLPRVLIIGGGFGGIKLAKSLKKAPFQVVMLDRNNYHTFQPLLYQVATGGLEPDSIAFPLRKIFGRQQNFVFRIAEVSHIDTQHKEVHTNLGEIAYDYLVIATGSNTNFFGQQQLETHAFGMKSVSEALDLRSLILNSFEEALHAPDADQRNRLMKFVVVGGGPTGVEMAGSLGELKLHVLPSDYPELDLRQMEIHLIEASGQLLGGMSEDSAEAALKALDKFGVHVWLNTYVESYDGNVITTNTGKNFETHTLIWAAGVKGNVPSGIPEDHVGRGNRLKVNAFNQVEGSDSIYAIGDVAYFETEAFPNGLPQVAPVAIQQAEQLAANLKRKQQGAPLVDFSYLDKGAMATIGRNKAVVDMGKFHLRGLFAWLTWMLVHLLFLIGFRNKLVVFVNWTWSYLTYDKGSRLIVRPFQRKKAKEPEPVPEL